MKNEKLLGSGMGLLLIAAIVAVIVLAVLYSNCRKDLDNCKKERNQYKLESKGWEESSDFCTGIIGCLTKVNEDGSSCISDECKKECIRFKPPPSN